MAILLYFSVYRPCRLLVNKINQYDTDKWLDLNQDLGNTTVLTVTKIVGGEIAHFNYSFDKLTKINYIKKIIAHWENLYFCNTVV